jgi:hypothetical protein
MLIFVNDDAACAHWLTHHRAGYAVEGMRNRKLTRLTLHSATCVALKDAIRRGRATTHGRWTACSLNEDELATWSVAEYGADPPRCDTCLPAGSESGIDGEEHPLTRLGRDVLDYVLDVAVIHLEPDARPYHLTVADVAQCLRKTPGQLSAALEHLTKSGMVVVEQPAGSRSPGRERHAIFPTTAALRKLPFFGVWKDEQLDAEIAKLRPGA